MPYRAVVIGCGKIGSEFADDPRVPGIYSHAGAYAACADTRLVAVCDRDPAKLERCGRRWQVADCYREARQLLMDVQPDIVSICTPDDTHADLLRLVLAAPGVRAVLVEKPLATDLQAARQLVDLAEDKRVVLAVNYSRRYAVNHTELQEFLQCGGIGAIQTIGGYYTRGTLHNGSHWFDLARFLVGPVSRVWGRDFLKETGDDPTLDAFLEFAGGASGHLHACAAQAFSLFEMDLVGIKGRVRLLDFGSAIEFYEVAESREYTGQQTLSLKERKQHGFRDVVLHAVQDLVHCLNTNSRPRCGGADGVAALEIALAVRESAASGKIVAMGHFR
jgi:predicted dehydrogenase